MAVTLADHLAVTMATKMVDLIATKMAGPMEHPTVVQLAATMADQKGDH